MKTTGERPQVRPLFRKIALAMAVVCFLLAGVLEFAPIGSKVLPVGASLGVGFVMLTIGKTGYWPPGRSH